MFQTDTETAEVQVAKSWQTMLEACPVQNRAARQDYEKENRLVLTIERKRPSFLFPPLSWIIRMNMSHRFRLDTLGICIWKLCDGRRSVEDIIVEFAGRFKLSFHEARVSVTNYIKELMQRGALVLVIDNQEVEL